MPERPRFYPIGQRTAAKEGLITLKQLYIDGTKIETNANRYTFVWRGILNYHLAGLLDTVDTLYKNTTPSYPNMDTEQSMILSVQYQISAQKIFVGVFMKSP